MLLALTDHLRCTADHAETWLVARADVVEDGRMVEGILGCPICHIERPVRNGVVHWSGTVVAPGTTAARDAHPDRVMRVGAMLSFGDSLIPFVLCGNEATVVNGLIGLAEAPIVLLDPPDDSAVRFASIVRGAPAIPFGAGVVRGIAVDDAHSGVAFLASCAKALGEGGRLLAPAATPIPTGIHELARDAEQWVGKKSGHHSVIPLRRA
jgi:hypothetical protein